MRLTALALAAMLWVSLSGPGARAVGAAPDPAAVLEAVSSADPPVRDLVAMRQRIVPPAPVVSGEPPPDALWVHDLVKRSYRLAQVDLVGSSAHADWLVERGRDPGDLVSAIEFFESRAYPRVTALTGVGWTPGENGQPRLTIFHGQTPGVAGYMSAGDGQPRSVFPYSNERLVLYLNLDSVRPGSRGYNGTLAHELEHLAHFVVNPNQEGWLDEGLAELVSNLVLEAPAPSLSNFRSHPNVQLTAWSERAWEAKAHYEASSLWARYLMERAGGPDGLPTVIQAGGRGLQTVDRFARSIGAAGGASGLFRDWLVANIVDDERSDQGRFGYRGLDQRSTTNGELRRGGPPVDDRVHQFAAAYYDLPSDDDGAQVRLAVAPTVSLIDTGDARGAFYWSLRGDNLDTRLTRRFDLTGLSRATLRYRVWYDLEPEYDQCYTLGSTDGSSWRPLVGRYTTPGSTVGAAFGPNYTGPSGKPPAWRDDEVDLSSLAGGPAFVRFECSTDQGYSAAGWAVDEIEIPELGFYDDAEADQGWLAEGFARAANAMKQPALALVVDQTANGPIVREVPLDASGQGTLGLRGASFGASHSYLVVAGLAPYTLEEMAFRAWVEPAP